MTNYVVFNMGIYLAEPLQVAIYRPREDVVRT